MRDFLRVEKTRRAPAVACNMAGQAKNLHGVLLDSRASATRASENPSSLSIRLYLFEPGQNRVDLDPDARDKYGVPLPRIAYRLDDYVKAGFAASRTAHEDIFNRLGATEIEHSPRAQGAGHIIGTARMGSDARSSVVDADLRSHDHPNLFILGSAVFPTSATANPTLTIAALALRAARSVEGAVSQ